MYAGPAIIALALVGDCGAAALMWTLEQTHHP
jgi:hypothetical protein